VTQQPLFGANLALDAQAAAVLRQARDPLGCSPDEAGAAAHDTMGLHDAGDRCDGCRPDGLRLLQQLRDLGVVRHTRRGTWVAAHDPATAPWPKGF
jgi:hypothetical protein